MPALPWLLNPAPLPKKHSSEIATTYLHAARGLLFAMPIPTSYLNLLFPPRVNLPLLLLRVREIFFLFGFLPKSRGTVYPVRPFLQSVGLSF